MFWLHCNGCYCQPEPGVLLRFHITNCSHIYCEKCVTECTKERCKVCQSQCATLELSGKLQKEVENLFDEPANIVQKALKQVNRTFEFQKSHQRRWSRHLKEMVRQQNQQLKEMKKIVLNCRNMEKELMELKKENSYLKCLLAKSDPGIRAGTRGVNYQGASPNQPMFGKSPQQAGPRGGNYQGASPNQSFFGKSPQQFMQMHTNSAHRSGGGVSSVLNRPGRILMRTPPSEGKLGTTRSHLSYLTPETDDARRCVPTPLSVPRPICLSQTD